MTPQIGDLYEAFVTVCACVGFLAGVQTHVGLEVMVTCEFLIALGTFEGFLTGVCSFVILQDVLVAKGTIADFAGEHFVFGCVFGGGGQSGQVFNGTV